MNRTIAPADLLRTVYLGDRACKALVMDGWNKRLSIQIDVISRIRSQSGNWDYYTAEDIVDGWLVFSDVRDLVGTFQSVLPNDFIEVRFVRTMAEVDSRLFEFEVALGAVDDEAKTTEVRLLVQAAGLHIEDPSQPGVRITS